MLVDLPLEELRKYKPKQTKEDDFEEFWKNNLRISKNEPLNEEILEINYIVRDIRTYKVYYDGFDKARICGYYLLPKTKGPHPVILQFHGYGSDKLEISYYLVWVLLGYAVLAIDIRGQMGESIDNRIYKGPSSIGLMTKGIFNKEDYYYRSVYIDCVRAIDFLETRKEVNMDRLCLTGSSQGGGLSLATAALDNRPKITIAEMPYLAHFKRSVYWAEEVKNITYFEIINLIKRYPDKEDDIFKTLSYFDNLNLCSWIKSRTVITCGLKDIVTPPSSIFAIYNHINADKHIEVKPFFDHSWETHIYFTEKKLEYIKKYL